MPYPYQYQQYPQPGMQPQQPVRQPQQAQPQTKNELDTIEKLKQYKELLDTNVITQEEFETKKKELLNQ